MSTNTQCKRRNSIQIATLSSLHEKHPAVEPWVFDQMEMILREKSVGGVHQHPTQHPKRYSAPQLNTSRNTTKKTMDLSLSSSSDHSCSYYNMLPVLHPKKHIPRCMRRLNSMPSLTAALQDAEQNEEEQQEKARKQQAVVYVDPRAARRKRRNKRRRNRNYGASSSSSRSNNNNKSCSALDEVTIEAAKKPPRMPTRVTSDDMDPYNPSSSSSSSTHPHPVLKELNSTCASSQPLRMPRRSSTGDVFLEEEESSLLLSEDEDAEEDEFSCDCSEESTVVFCAQDDVPDHPCAPILGQDDSSPQKSCTTQNKVKPPTLGNDSLQSALRTQHRIQQQKNKKEKALTTFAKLDHNHHQSQSPCSPRRELVQVVETLQQYHSEFF